MAQDVEKRDTGSDRPAPRYSDPFSALRNEMDRLFDNFTGSGFGSLSNFPRSLAGLSSASAVVPQLDVRESDKEIVVEAELPGIEEKDISLTFQDGILVLKGEKKFENKEEKDNYHLMERRYGSFQRTMRVPDSVDEDNVQANFDNGVLTVTMPKKPEAVKKEKKIEINSR